MYEKFANCYDALMNTVSYDEWAEYIDKLINEHCAKKPEIILDLGCGTGSMAIRLADKGYELIAVDSSVEMLLKAEEKSEEYAKKAEEEGRSFKKPLFLAQDMRSFELYGTVDCVICTCDSLNYITEDEDVYKVFRLVENYLSPGGVFIFDVNSEYKYRRLLADNTIAEADENAAFIWENTFDRKTGINEYFVTFFTENEDGTYERFEENHRQRAYSVSGIKGLLKTAGLKPVATYDAFTFKPARAASERIQFVAKEVLFDKLGYKRKLDDN